MNFKVGDKVILVRPCISALGKVFTVEEILNFYPEFKEPQEIVEIKHSPSLLNFYRPKDMPDLCFMINYEKIEIPYACFDLYSSIAIPRPKKCCCSIKDLMIRGCKCGGI